MIGPTSMGRYQTTAGGSSLSAGQQTFIQPPGPHLNIETVFPRYGVSHVKDKTVAETVLSLTWESLYW